MHNWQDLHLKKEMPISQQTYKLFCIVKQNQDLNKENIQTYPSKHTNVFWICATQWDSEDKVVMMNLYELVIIQLI